MMSDTRLSLVEICDAREFVSREITERLMRAHGVVAVLPASELGVKMRDVPAVGDYLIKLLVVRVISSVVQSRTVIPPIITRRGAAKVRFLTWPRRVTRATPGLLAASRVE